mmetsp:Transcript_24740/g.51693  ORF Transcript_24740/g.51693 Transcript_24740/m.51693 type:complete len:208 (-) Transcript_24740:880-1503(-)
MPRPWLTAAVRGAGAGGPASLRTRPCRGEQAVPAATSPAGNRRRWGLRAGAVPAGSACPAAVATGAASRTERPTAGAPLDRAASRLRGRRVRLHGGTQAGLLARELGSAAPPRRTDTRADDSLWNPCDYGWHRVGLSACLVAPARRPAPTYVRTHSGEGDRLGLLVAGRRGFAGRGCRRHRSSSRRCNGGRSPGRPVSDSRNSNGPW